MGLVTAIAPVAPARMGEPVEPAAMLRFLSELVAWSERRRAELAELDAAALTAADAGALTGDITLSMTLWQAVAGRLAQIEQVWDDGRVGPVERQRLSALVWGRLDADAGPGSASLAISLPEACRLSDALAAQLSWRLSLDPVGVDLAAHLRSLRATLERVRDLLPGEQAGPVRDAAAERLLRIDRRLEDATARAGRGADVGGLIGPLESDAALLERDLIVAAATRRDDERDRARAHALRDRLLERSVVVDRVVDDCVAQIRSAPTLAVPRVEALGPVPDDALAVDAYLVRLAAVARALTLAEQAYGGPLAELSDLRALLDVYHAKAAGTGHAAHPEVAEMYKQALAVVNEPPTDLARARAVVGAYQLLLGGSAGPTPEGRSS
ncbi:hypothetical protein [Pengzhenrongella frigida]|uniref:Uncharacterized protein n=1 Tax=Pengzhenrongella frigida TaxID=1259133 RepID=A0A4Q5MYY8_9MICO|nr:hypothetical protein [Cellulomonas sp. HLT2-17]RYV50925.1 hypothetical protein EUA98_11090 [Cellulomonas sp. HLT2-17]